jgi:hypothetical protein
MTSRNPAFFHATARFERTFLCATLFLLPVSSALAAPYVQLGVATDVTHHINKTEINVGWDTGYKWGNPDGWLLNLDAELALARWNPTRGERQRGITEFGVSPIFRLEKRGGSVVPFIEASVGVRLLSHRSPTEDHDMGSAFQFADMLGIGVKLGKADQFALGYRFQHISNAGLERPNPGVNFNTIYLRYQF